MKVLEPEVESIEAKGIVKKVKAPQAESDRILRKSGEVMLKSGSAVRIIKGKDPIMGVRMSREQQNKIGLAI